MKETDVKPADAAELRDIADYYDTIASWRRIRDQPAALEDTTRAARVRALADFLSRHSDELTECDHGKLAGKCGVCDNDE